MTEEFNKYNFIDVLEESGQITVPQSELVEILADQYTHLEVKKLVPIFDLMRLVPSLGKDLNVKETSTSLNDMIDHINAISIQNNCGYVIVIHWGELVLVSIDSKWWEKSQKNNNQ